MLGFSRALPFAALTAFSIATAALAPAASAAEKLIMATTGVASAQQWPIWIANVKGFLAANGVEVDFVGAPSAAAVAR